MRSRLEAKIFGTLFLSALILISCATVPVNLTKAYYLPAEGGKTLYLNGSGAELFLEPLAETMGVDDYGKIKPILEKTEKIYLVNERNVLYIQGRGDYNSGFINLFLKANREWQKEKIGPFKAYRSRSTGLQMAFPDRSTFLISDGALSDLLDSYFIGGSQDYPFDPAREKEESLLLRYSLEKDSVIPLQSYMKTPFKMIEIALTPREDGLLLMDVKLQGEEKSGRFLGTALKLFLLASIGRDVMKSSLDSGDDYARMSDIPVDFDFLLGLLGI